MSAPAPHIPVMLPEVVTYLQPKDGGVYVDGTFGAGGYSKAILAAANCTVYGIDRDPGIAPYAEKLAREYGTRFKLLTGNFAAMETLLAAEGVAQVDGIVLDVGVSSMQLDEAGRGFSFQADGPLDMRMEQNGPDAASLINHIREDELADILFTLGGERKSRRVAKAIIMARALEPITRTRQLAEIIRKALGGRKGEAIDPATRSFQAIRIHINGELEALHEALEAAEKLLKTGGRLVVVSFHELEDSIVKTFLKERSGDAAGGGSRHLPDAPKSTQAVTFRKITRKAALPSESEIKANFRARSARLRAAERVAA